MAIDALGPHPAPRIASPTLKLSRRHFLTTGMLVGGAVRGADLLGDVLGELDVRRMDKPNIPETRLPLLVTMGGATWMVDPQLFGNSAVLRHHFDENIQQHRLELKRAMFPGVKLAANFIAHIFRSQGDWALRISFEAADEERHFRLFDWMQPQQVPVATARYVARLRDNGGSVELGNGRCVVSARKGDIQFCVDAAMKVALESEHGLSFFNKRFTFSLDSLHLQVTDVLSDTQEHMSALGHAVAPYSLITLNSLACLNNEIELVRVGQRQQSFLHVGSLPQASFVTHGFGSEREGTFLLQESWRPGCVDVRDAPCMPSLIVRGGACGPSGTRVPLQRYVILGNLNRLREDLQISFYVAQAEGLGLGMETSSLTVLVSGTVDPVVMDLRGARTDTLRFPVQLRGVDIPVPGVSSAQLQFLPSSHTPRPLRLDVQIGDVKGAATPVAEVAHLHLDKDSQLALQLDRMQLRLRRSIDNVDLKFQLSHFDLAVRYGVTTVRQRLLPSRFKPGEPDFPCLRIEFPPQHTAEETFAKKVPTRAGVPPANPDTKAPRPHLAPRDITSRRPNLARTRLANKSRLVFDLSDKKFPPQAQVLTLEWLTDWRNATLKVNKRALPRNAGLAEQLRVSGLLPGTERKDARRTVRQAILADNKGEPGAYETAIEPVYRMIVSPDAGARFVAPHSAPDKQLPVVWRTVLENHADIATRALWARGMDTELSFISADDPEPPPVFAEAFATSLDGNDRREIVAMTSFYGLAATRRLMPEPPTLFSAAFGLFQGDCESGEHTWKDDPNGMVFMPPERYAYLAPDKKCGLPQEGIMLAKPFDRFQLRMGRTADVNAFWKGEPPAALFLDRFFHPAFTIERYAHRTVQGRDVFVEVIYKGFLFPIGQRAAYVKLSTFDYQAYLDEPLGDPTAYLTQDYYIVCNKPEKKFRAYNQPFNSHDFPCRSITLLTTRTGSLNSPESWLQTAVEDKTRPEGKVFWPKINSGILPALGQDVIFSFQIDGQPGTAAMPLLFVDNAAAHHPPTMSTIVRKYNQEVDRKLRTMSHQGVVRRYAPELKQGECSFKTNEWLLAARGRIDGESGLESFEMDAFMEGQDQPPFYPVLEQANIHVESVERLTGQPGRYIDAAFNAQYVRHGFNSAQNPSEIYIDVLTAGVMLNGSGAQGATGGVATMAAELACLSRKIGVVGGQPVAPQATTSARSLTATGTATTAPAGASVGGVIPRCHDTSNAFLGGFCPVEFLGNAKLFGFIVLKQVCQAALISSAPKLREQVEHGVKEVQGKLEHAVGEMRMQLASALEVIETALGKCRAEAQQALAAQAPGLTLKDLYPALERALRNLEQTLAGLRAALKSGVDLIGLQHQASELKNTVDQLLHELASIARDPTPSIVGNTLKALQKMWTGISASLDGLLKDLVKGLVDQALTDLFTGLCTPGNRYLLTAVFGRVALSLPNEDERAYAARMIGLLRNPSDALDDMYEALLYESFTKPMIQVLQVISQAQGQANHLLSWSRRTMVQAMLGALCRNVVSFRPETLAAPAQAVCNAIEKAITLQPMHPAQLRGEIERTLNDAVHACRQQFGVATLAVEALAHQEISDARGHIDNYLAKELDGAVSEQDRKDYREACVLLHRAADVAGEARKLIDAINSKTWDDLRKNMVDALRSEFMRVIDAKLREIEKFAKGQLDSAVNMTIDLARRVLAMLVSWSGVSQVQELGQSLGALCSAAGTEVTKAIATLSVGLLGPRDVVGTRLLAIDTALLDAYLRLDALAPPTGPLMALREALQGKLGTLIGRTGLVRQLIAEADDLREQWTQAIAGCKVDRIFDLSRAFLALRTRAPELIGATLESAQACIDACKLQQNAGSIQPILDLVIVEVKQAMTSLYLLLGDMTGLAMIAANHAIWGEQRRFLESVVKIPDTAGELESLAKRWLTGSQQAVDTARAVRLAFSRLERHRADLMFQLILPHGQFITQMQAAIKAIATQTAGLLSKPHQLVAKQLTEFEQLIGNNENDHVVLSSLLKADLVGQLRVATAAVNEDARALNGIAAWTSQASGVQAVKKLGDAWADGNSGVLRATALASEVVELVSSGNIMGLFDVGFIERELRRAVASFVPTKVTLSYDFDAALSGFPSADPVFLMDRASYGTDKEVLYAGEKTPPVNDLVLKTKVDIDLMTGKRVLHAEGRLRPFTLNLLGKSLDLIGISFGGARFLSKPGGKLALDTAISGVRIGAMLQFLTEIQKYFSSGDDNGIYYDMQFFPPTLEVGYRYYQPLIPIGAMLLLNIGFRVGARLPLEDRPAEFFAQLSTREKPLLIVMTPYGGGGFFGLRANAGGIVSFEIQLEFGFVGALSIGPLAAQARATVGFYLMQAGDQRIFEGFFHAVGEGHLGCFGVGVNIEIRLRQTNGGAMVGTARYGYIFKVGFFKIKFEVVASRSQGNGSQGGSGARNQRAGSATHALLGGTRAGSHCGPAGKPSLTRTKTLRKERQWNRYKDHLDLGRNER